MQGPSPSMHQLQSLGLAGTPLNDAAASIVGSALRYLPALGVLDVRMCSLELSAVSRLADGMGGGLPSGMHTFLIGGNWRDCGVRCTKEVCRGLASGNARSLTNLDMANGMLPEGAQHLCEAIASLQL